MSLLLPALSSTEICDPDGCPCTFPGVAQFSRLALTLEPQHLTLTCHPGRVPTNTCVRTYSSFFLPACALPVAFPLMLLATSQSRCKGGPLAKPKSL